LRSTGSAFTTLPFLQIAIVFNVKAGYEYKASDVLFFTGMAGFATHKFTGSYKSQNFTKNYPIIYLEGARQWNSARVFVSGTHSGNESFGSVGLTYIFD